MLEKRPAWFLKFFFKTPVWLYRIGLGGFERVFGAEWMLLTTIGRKSGKPRYTALEYVYVKENDRYRVAAGWGGHTDWYRNLLKNPNVKVQVGRRKFEAVAERVCDEEVAKYMIYVSKRHPRMDKVWNRWSGKPVDGTFESYVHAAKSFPSVWLKPSSHE